MLAGVGRRVHEHGIADWRARGVLDARRIEYLTLNIADEKAGRGRGPRGWPRVGNPLHEGQHVPEDGEVDVVIVRHLLVHLLDALPDLFPRRIVGLEDPAAVEAESCPAGQQFTEGDGVDTRAFHPVRGRNGQIRRSMLRWCRASDFRTAIVVNILPTLATFTMTSGPMASRGASAAVRARPEATTCDGPTSAT